MRSPMMVPAPSSLCKLQNARVAIETYHLSLMKERSVIV